jgi:O-antigen ligase
LLAKRSTISPTPKALRRTGFACLAFLAVAAFTVTRTPDVLSSGRFLLDSFLVPLLFGWLIIASFNVRRHLPMLHTAMCIASVICATVAAAEIVTGEDLIPISGSKMFFAGGIARPNGPFASDDKLAVIGGVCLFLLFFLRAALGSNVSTARRVIHFTGLTAAIGMSLMPMFRSMMLTLVLVLVIDTFWERRPSQRAWRVTLLAAFIGLVLVIRVAMPDVFEDRAGSDNFYGRIAEYEQSFKVFVDHPLLGVGYNNFNNAVAGISQYRASYEGVASLDWPHSNFNSVLVETGILGFIPWAMMHIFLLKAFWQLRRVSAAGRMVWKFVLYMMMCYWITGLTEACGTDPLNTVYVFAILVCYKYAATAPDAVFPAESQASAQIRSSQPQFSYESSI